MSIVSDKMNRLFARKEYYMICAKDADKYEEISQLYKQCRDVYVEYHGSLCDSAIAQIALRDSYKMKADPYIVGGIAQGIGGVGAGIYAASETARKNGNLSVSDKIQLNLNANQAKYNSDMLKLRFDRTVDRAYSLIMKLPNIDKADKDYEEYKAKEKAMSEKIEVAKKALEEFNLGTGGKANGIGAIFGGSFFSLIGLSFIFIGDSISPGDYTVSLLGLVPLGAGIAFICMGRSWVNRQKFIESKYPNETLETMRSKVKEAELNLLEFQKNYKESLKTKTYKIVRKPKQI